jgi:hypothetical protein
MQSYTTQISCQAENTLTFALILRGSCALAVDKNVEILWIKMWIFSQRFQ